MILIYLHKPQRLEKSIQVNTNNLPQDNSSQIITPVIVQPTVEIPIESKILWFKLVVAKIKKFFGGRK